MEIMEDIRVGGHQYYVREKPYESKVRVVSRGDGDRLVTTRGIISLNNLSNLPDC
jgi:hypothetical protein